MGREVRRVPLDFDWPLNKVWEGFVNPAYAERRKCPTCDGDSHSPAGRLLNDLWYFRLYSKRVDREIVEGLARKPRLPLALLTFAARIVTGGVPWRDALEQRDVDALLRADRLWDFTRRPLNDEQRAACHPNGWTNEHNGYHPTAEEVNAWSRHGFGHDSINAWICRRERAKLYGVGLACRACRGTGHVPDAALARRIRAWRETPVPEGDGWQVWETASEGSPVTPVFATPEALAHHMANVGIWDHRTPYDAALRWITGPGHAMSAVMIGGQLVDPIVAAVDPHA